MRASDSVNEAALYGLYAILAAGAVGLYLSLPSTRADAGALRRAGSVLGIAALAAAVIFLTQWLGSGFEGRAFFVIFAAMAVIAAARVVTHQRPVYSAMYFVVVVLASAGLSILAAAEFLGIALVIIYGGAILVTYVFVIMLAQQAGEASYDRKAREPLAAVLMGFLLVAATTQAMAMKDPIAAKQNQDGVHYRLAADQHTAADSQANKHAATPADAASPVGNTRAIGEILLTTYVMAMEVAGVLLLVAVVGAIAIARKHIEIEALTPEELRQAQDREDVHRRGREVTPF